MKTSVQFTYTDSFNPSAPIRVDRIEIQWLTDEGASLDNLGTYGHAATSPAAIDRAALGHQMRGEFRWFNPAMTGDETGNPESPAQDYARAEAYNRGEWSMLGCVAVATISRPCGQGSRRLDKLTSGGLWGVESDSGADYLKSVESEQMADLAEHLKAFGIECPAPAPAI